MISVLTLTYKRHHLLEEAIQSFLLQETSHPKEMVIINDNKDVDYVFDHPEIRVINHKERFPSIPAKLKWGFEQCKYNHVYRLDDDDLLSPTALFSACDDIERNPGYDVYRSSGFYFFVDNKFHRISSNINNGNIYSKEYISRIKWPEDSIGEDADITFNQGAKVYHSKNHPPTMIYRWGMKTFHLSGAGNRPSELALKQADETLSRIGGDLTGTVNLEPKFNSNYYNQIQMKNYIQIGANTGNDEFQSIVTNCSEKINIFLLEPNIDVIETLYSSYKDVSKKHNVVICPYGISLNTGVKEFYMYGNIDGNYSMLNRKTHPLKDVATSKKIFTKTFEEFCRDFDIRHVECLFIDTEGLDYEILNSINLDSVDIKTIIFEEWVHEEDDMNKIYQTGPKYLHEVLVPKFKDYHWSEFVSGGMNNFRLTKK